MIGLPQMVLLASAIVPLLFFDAFFFPYVTFKALVFFVLVEIASVFALFDLLSGTVRLRLSPLGILLGVFVAVVGIADIFGVYPSLSIWSTFERMEGFVMLAHAYAFFILLTLYFDERLWRWFWLLVTAAAFVAGAFGVAQALGGVVRPGSLFGNPIYFAGFELFAFGIAVLLLSQYHAFALRAWLSMVLIVSVAGIFISGTRGALLGLLAGVGAFLIIAVWRRLLSRRLFMWIVGACIFFGVSFFLFVHTTGVLSSTFERFRSVSFEDPTVRSRLLLADMAWKGLLERPVLGYGQEGFIDVYARHYNPQLFGYEPWHDRVHNVFLDWFVASGFVGGVLFLLCMSMLGISILRFSSMQEQAYVGGLLFGYLAYLATVFLDVTGYILLFALVAFVESRNRSSWNQENTNTMPQHMRALRIGVGIVGVISVLMFAVPYIVSVRSTLLGLYHAEYMYVFAQKKEATLLEQASSASRDAFERASRMSERRLREVHEQQSIVAMRALGLPLSERERTQWMQMAAKGLLYNVELFPNDPRQWVLYGDLLYASGQYTASKEAYEHALVLSPQKQTTMLLLARAEASLKNYARANELIDAVLESEHTSLAPVTEVKLFRESIKEVEDASLLR